MNFIRTFSKKLLIVSNRLLRIKGEKIEKRNYSGTEERKVKIGKQTINYLKVGKGDKSILCFPGALGTIWSDFKPQIIGLDQDKFTIIAFDPPGYGLSRPPDRIFTTNFYKSDASVAYQLMKNLNINKFSLLGWSDGGISSIILAAECPQCVDNLIIWGANSYILSEDIEAFEAIRDTNHWSKKAREPLIALYGENGLQKMWNDWCDTQIELHKNGGNVCMEYVSKVECPTLIIHGAKDPVVQPEHPNYINANIKKSSLYIFPEGKHNVHLRYAQKFNQIITDFILSDIQSKL